MIGTNRGRAGSQGGPGVATEEHVSDWTLERLILGELPAAQVDRLRARAALDAALQARIDALVADDARTLAAMPPAESAAAITRRRHLSKVARMAAAPSNPSRWHGWAVIGAPALLAAGLAGLWMRSAPVEVPGAAERGVVDEPRLGERAKGGARGPQSLSVFRKRGELLERLSDGGTARAGDLLQVAMRSETAQRCAVVSVDGGGTVTRHLPEEGDTPLTVNPGEAPQSAHAYELDDAPRYERFVLACGAAPFAVGALVRAVQDADRRGADVLPTLSGVAVQTLTLRKLGTATPVSVEVPASTGAGPAGAAPRPASVKSPLSPVGSPPGAVATP